jgi:hypothetical protein
MALLIASELDIDPTPSPFMLSKALGDSRALEVLFSDIFESESSNPGPESNDEFARDLALPVFALYPL